MTPALHDARDRARIRGDAPSGALDETLIVEAAAGTGKTTELVGRIVRVLELRMLPADTTERFTLATAPRGEQLARQALRNVEMRPWGQAPRYGGHNQTSCEGALGPHASGRKSG